MSDLISRSELLEQLLESKDNGIIKAVIELVESQPTAYDKEKVVAELIQFGLNSMDKQIYDSDTYYDGVSVAIRKACNIVKRGGVE